MRLLFGWSEMRIASLQVFPGQVTEVMDSVVRVTEGKSEGFLFMVIGVVFILYTAYSDKKDAREDAKRNAESMDRISDAMADSSQAIEKIAAGFDNYQKVASLLLEAGEQEASGLQEEAKATRLHAKHLLDG